MNCTRATPRILGLLFLTLSIVQVIVGLTLLKDKLSAVAALLFWSVCFLATFAAVLCALLDALRNLNQSRRERHTLIEQTLREVGEESIRRKQAAARENHDSR